MAVLMAAGGAYALASYNWCGRSPEAKTALLSSARSTEPLRAGAGIAELSVPWPVVAAGYAPPRPEVKSWSHPLAARAVVLAAGPVKTAIISIDALLVTQTITDEVRRRIAVPDAWVVATHAHSSLGGIDQRVLAQLAGTGRYKPSAERAVIDAAVEAFKRADATLQPVRLESGTLADAHLNAPRSGADVDRRLARVRLIGETAAVAQLVLFAAHPTLVPRKPAGLDPDYPAALRAAREAAGDGVTLVLQTAAGNAATDQTPGENADAYGARVAEAVGGITTEADASTGLALARFSMVPPAVDASRLVPRLFANPGNNFLCASADRTAEVAALRLGSLVLLALPGEPSFTVGQALEASSPLRVVGLANGYLGYVEAAALVDTNEGEARRQYFNRELADRLQAAATEAVKAVALPAEADGGNP